MSTNAALVDAAGLTVRAALDEATRLARLRREVHEASLVLVPLVRRFRATRDSLQTAIDDKRPLTMPHEKLVEQFAVEIEKLIRLIKKQKNATLATRVVDAERLAAEIQALHGGMGDNGTCTSGLSRIHSSIGEWNGDAWRRDVDTAISDYKQALREAVDTCLPDMERDPAMVREALILLEHEKKRGLLSPLGEHLWDRIRTLAPADVIEVPAWFISESDIVFTSRVFDRGGFATIHHATWDGSTVVTKVLRDADMATFAREVEIGFKLSHPHVVKIYGACHTSEPPFIVCEFAKNGNMGNYLVSHPDEKWRLLYEAALGLRFLHRNKIVHGDLKLNNILVMEDGKAKIADFGLSRRKETSKATTLADNTSTGAIRWRAPECFKTKPTFQSDVYSFGMCVYEAVSGKVPYEDIDSLGSVEKMIREGELPAWPADNVASSAQRLFQQMSRLEKEDRIDLESAIIELKILADEELQLKCSFLPSTIEDGNVGGVGDASFILDSESRAVRSKLDTGSVDGSAANNDYEGIAVVSDTNPEFEETRKAFVLHLIQVLVTGSENEKVQAAFQLANIAANSNDARQTIVDAGAISPLVQLLTTGPDAQKLQASICLGNIAAGSLERTTMIIAAGALDPLLEYLGSGSDRGKAYAASTIANLAGTSPEICAAIVDGGGILLLHRLLDSGVDGCKLNAVIALSQLTTYSPERVASTGVIHSLVDFLATASDQESYNVSVILGNLAANSPERSAQIAKAGGIAALTRVLETATPATETSLAGTLCNLAACSEERSLEMVQVGAIELLLGLINRGTEEGQANAAGALANITSSSPKCAAAVKEAGGVAPLLRLMNVGTSGGRVNAMQALGPLLESSVRPATPTGELHIRGDELIRESKRRKLN